MTPFKAVSSKFGSGRRHLFVITESYQASEANPKKCHPFLELKPRKTLCLSLSPATGIDSHFYWEMEKFVMITLKIPVVSSFFMSLHKTNTVFLKRHPKVKKFWGVFLVFLVQFLHVFQHCFFLFFVFFWCVFSVTCGSEKGLF